MDKEKIMNRIEEFRIKKHWSRNELAENAGLSAGMIYQWYNSSRTPSLNTIECICRALNISLSLFFAESDIAKMSVKQNELSEFSKKLTERQIEAVIELGKSFIE